MLLTLAILLPQVPRAFGIGMPSTDPRRDFAAGKDVAVMMLKPTTVCDGQTGEYVWTSDGSSVVTKRLAVDLSTADVAANLTGKPPSPADLARFRPRTELISWSLRTRKSTTLMTIPATEGGFDELAAMPGSDRVLMLSRQRLPGPNGAADRTLVSVLMVATGSGNVTRVASEDGNGTPEMSFSVSPTRPLGVVQWRRPDSTPGMARFFGPAGMLGVAVAIPSYAFLTYDERGMPRLISVAKIDGKRVRQAQPIDPATGRLGVAARLPAPVPPENPRPEQLTLSIDRKVVSPGVFAPMVVLRVEGGKPEEAGIVSTDGSEPNLSPKLDAVAYVSQGGLRVRPLAKVPRSAYNLALAAEARLVALSNAKQVGLGFLLYAGDMDDVLPGKDSDIRNLIGPYLKNDGLFDGFVYEFKGGKMTDIESPAETVLGYVPGPGGRAVVYTDGHAKWISDGG